MTKTKNPIAKALRNPSLRPQVMPRKREETAHEALRRELREAKIASCTKVFND